MSETSIADISKKYGIPEKEVIDIILKEEIEAFFVNETVRVVKERYSPYQEDRIIFTYKVGMNAGILPDHLKVLRHADKVRIKIIDADSSGTTYLTPPVELSTSRVFVLDDHLQKFIGDTAKKPEEKQGCDYLSNVGGDHAKQEQCFIDEMKRRKIPDFQKMPDGERASLIRFFVNHGAMGEEVAKKAWQRLLDGNSVKSVKNTRKVKT
jgi:hypothetical protein